MRVSLIVTTYNWPQALGLTLASVTRLVTGTDSLNYRMGLLPRRDIDPGWTEYLEITFAPTGPGQSSAQLEIVGSDGTIETVTLGGVALRVNRDPADQSLAQPAAMPGGIGRAQAPTLR